MVGVMVVVIIGVRKGVRVGVKERFASGSVFRTFFWGGLCQPQRLRVWISCKERVGVLMDSCFGPGFIIIRPF